MPQLDPLQVLPYGSTGILLLLMFYGAKFSGKMLEQALAAFRDAAQKHEIALQAIITQVYASREVLQQDLKATRHDLRNDLTVATAAPAQQLLERLEHLQQTVMNEIRELRDDIAKAGVNVPVVPMRR